MPLSGRGRSLAELLPRTAAVAGAGLGCEVVRRDELCVGCGRCAAACPSGASRRGDTFDVAQFLEAPAGSRRGDLAAALRRLMRQAPTGPIVVPPRVTVFRTIVHDTAACLGCGTCVRGCPAGAIEARPAATGARPPQAESAGQP